MISSVIVWAKVKINPSCCSETKWVPLDITCCGLLLYSTILCSWADPLCSQVILQKRIAFYSAFFYILFLSTYQVAASFLLNIEALLLVSMAVSCFWALMTYRYMSSVRPNNFMADALFTFASNFIWLHIYLCSILIGMCAKCRTTSCVAGKSTEFVGLTDV